MPGIGALLVLAAAVFASASNVLGKSVVTKMPFGRFLVGRSIGAALVLLFLFHGSGSKFALPWWAIPLLLSAGCIWPGVINLLVYHALRRLPVNISRPVYQSWPAMAFIGSLIVGDPGAVLGAATIAGIFLALGGAAAFGHLKPAGEAVQDFRRRDVALTALAAFLQSIGALLMRYLVDRMGLPPISLNFLFVSGFFFLFAGLSPVIDMNDPRRTDAGTTELKRFAVSALSGALIFGCGNTCFMASQKFIEPGIAGSIYTLNVPLTAGIAWLFLKEKWTWKQALAAGLVVAGGALLALGR